MEDKEKENLEEEKDPSEEDGAKGEGVEELDCCGEEILRLEEKIISLESEIYDLKRNHEKQLLEFIEKKSNEASKILSDREKELFEKYSREFENSRKYLYERQLSDLVQIVSQFENVMNSITNPEVANYLVGFRMFLSKFQDLLGDLDISPLDPKAGEEFNSETMEATSVVSSEDPQSHNKITKVFSRGYRLYERIIKLASVEVTKFEK